MTTKYLKKLDIRNTLLLQKLRMPKENDDLFEAYTNNFKSSGVKYRLTQQW